MTINERVLLGESEGVTMLALVAEDILLEERLATEMEIRTSRKPNDRY